MLSQKIASEGACAQARDIPKLQERAAALVNSHRVPSALAESFMSGVNGLITPVCLPAVTPSAPAPPAPPPPHEKHGHGHGHGKHKEKDH